MVGMTRRFLQQMGGECVVCLAKSAAFGPDVSLTKKIMKLKIKTACNRDCPDGCGVIATVENNKVIRLQGDPDHPVTQGFLCHRTSRYLDRQYDPNRITSAMIRRDKNTDQWEAVSIDEALDLVAGKLVEFRDEFGAASILNYRCGGSMGMMKYVTDYFFQLFGPTTIKIGDICAGAGDWAQETDFGTQDANDFFDLLNAKTIFLWGKNVYVSHVHLLPLLKKAKANGTRIVLIDPIKHRTASLADRYVSIEPGGDAALAFGIARWCYEHDRLDPLVADYCDNLDAYIKLIQSRSMAQWAEMAGLDEQTLIELAQEYSRGPTTILVGWGMQRRRNGAAIIRAVDALGAVTGNIGKPGASVSFYFPRKGAYDLSFLDDRQAPRGIPEPILGKEIEAADDPPIKMVFVSAANPVTNLPDSKTTARALTDRFTVVVDMFMTDTARCADVILPAVTMLEDNDLIGAYGHHYINRLKPIVAAPGDAMTDYAIMQQLAHRVGMAGRFEDDAETWLRKMSASLENYGIDFESIGNDVVRNPNSAKVVFEDRKFPTPSGNVNLITEYVHPKNDLPKQFPLRLMALSTDQCQAAQWQSSDQEGAAELRVHPNAANGFTDGQIVTVESETGWLQMKIQHCSDQHPELAVMDKGGWLSAGRCANAITPAESSDHGHCAVYYDTPVRIAPCED